MYRIVLPSAVALDSALLGLLIMKRRLFSSSIFGLNVIKLSFLLIGLANFASAKSSTYPTASMSNWSYETRYIGSKVINNPSVTVLSEEKAQELYRFMAAKSYIPRAGVAGGCEVGAYQIAMSAENLKIFVGKAFLTGPLINSWVYHVAPFVLVSVDGKLVPYMLDLVVGGKAIPISDWVDHLVGFNFRIHQIYITNRYIYRIENREMPLDGYRLRDQLKKNLGILYFNIVN